MQTVLIPPIKKTFWEKLGFCLPRTTFAVDEYPEYPNYIVTEIITNLTFWGFVRLLISRRIMLYVLTKTDVLVNVAHSKSAFGILPPGKKNEEKKPNK